MDEVKNEAEKQVDNENKIEEETVKEGNKYLDMIKRIITLAIILAVVIAVLNAAVKFAA
jgi:hypothetical protein